MLRGEMLGQPLTPRELEIAHEIARDFTNQEIAGHLDIGIGTVTKHIAAIFAKLDAQTRIGMLRGLDWLHDGDEHVQAAFVAAAIVHMQRDLDTIIADAQRLRADLA